MCDRVFHLKSQWLGKYIIDSWTYLIDICFLDHLKSKTHKRMLRENQRKTFRRNLNNAIPDLLNTLDELQAQKMQEEKEKESDEDEEKGKE